MEVLDNEIRRKYSKFLIPEEIGTVRDIYKEIFKRIPLIKYDHEIGADNYWIKYKIQAISEEEINF